MRSSPCPRGRGLLSSRAPGGFKVFIAAGFPGLLAGGVAKLIVFFTLIFSVVFSMYPAVSIDEAPEFYLQWYFDPAGTWTTPRPRGKAWRAPFNLVARGQGEGRQLILPDRPPISPPAEALISSSFHGAGYFEYRKVGKEILFHDSARGEVLWTKTFFSYPVPDHYGNLTLLLTGDSNRVDLLDPSGNLTGVQGVAGNVLTDFDFAARESRAVLAFSDGKATALERDGSVLFQTEISVRESPFFLKSAALGPEGLYAALHYQSGPNDYVRVIRKQAEGTEVDVLGGAQLPAVYPHLVHMAVAEGGLVVGAPDFTAFYDTDGDEVWKRPLQRGQGAPLQVYRPVYADREFFAFGEGEFVYVLDGDGRTLAILPIDSYGRPYRFLPGPEEGSFAIQTDLALHFYRFAARPD